MPLYLHQACIVQATAEAKALLYCMANLCNNSALASTVLSCNQQSFHQCVCVQVAKRARTTTDDYLHDLLRKSENRALEAEGQTRHYSQRVRALEWLEFYLCTLSRRRGQAPELQAGGNRCTPSAFASIELRTAWPRPQESLHDVVNC